MLDRAGLSHTRYPQRIVRAQPSRHPLATPFLPHRVSSGHGEPPGTPRRAANCTSQSSFYATGGALGPPARSLEHSAREPGAHSAGAAGDQSLASRSRGRVHGARTSVRMQARRPGTHRAHLSGRRMVVRAAPALRFDVAIERRTAPACREAAHADPRPVRLGALRSETRERLFHIHPDRGDQQRPCRARRRI